MDYKTLLNQAGKDVEELIKKTIKSKGLVETGKLVNSVSASVSFDSKGELNINVKTEDYFKYLDKEHNITRDAFASSDYKKILEKIQEAYILFIKEHLYK